MDDIIRQFYTTMRIEPDLDSVRAAPNQSRLGRFYSRRFWLESNRFRELIHRYPHVTNAPHPSVCMVLQWIVQNFWRCESIISFV